MISSVREFWKRLESSVHPDDEPYFRATPHTFNLDFPPPAFNGDIDNAPVVILMLNGGYDRNGTPNEFADPHDCAEYLSWIKGERSQFPKNLSAYYTQSPEFPWIREGKAVIVNAVAYRSKGLTRERENQRLAKRLPSVKVHRSWLRNEVLPDAEKGRRMIIVHRWSLWNFEPSEFRETANVYYSKNPVSPYLADDLRERIKSFLNSVADTAPRTARGPLTPPS
jgi:hypothetical protein